MATATRMYMLLIMTKASDFFPKGSDKYERYRDVMLKNFNFDISDKSFKPNVFVIESGRELFEKVQISSRNFVSYAKSYGVQPRPGDLGF